MDAALAVQQGLEARAAWKFPSPAPTSPKKASVAGTTYPVARRMRLSERRIVRSLKGDFTNSRAASDARKSAASSTDLLLPPRRHAALACQDCPARPWLEGEGNETDQTESACRLG